MFGKKLLIAVLALVILGVGATYYSSASLQGKFSTSSIKTASSINRTFLTVSAATAKTPPFLSKTNATSSYPFGEFTVTLGKSASELRSCEYKLGTYNNGTMYSAVYDSSIDHNPSFVKNIYLSVSDSSRYLEDESPSDVVYSTFVTDFTEAYYSLTSGNVYTYKMKGNVDPNSELGAKAGDLSNYTANTGEFYLTEINCSYLGSEWAHYTWDANDSKGENKNFSVATYEKGKGIKLGGVIIGN